MKAALIILGVLSLHHYCRAGFIPAFTAFVRHATSITHPSPVAYSKPGLAYAYGSPVAYSLYPQPFIQYSPGLFTPQKLFAPHPIFPQYPGLFPQGFPFVGAQQTPAGGAPSSEAADKPQNGGVQQPSAPQQSPDSGSGTPGMAADDDTVSIEASQ